MKLVYTAAAVDDLERLWAFVREKNPQAPQRVADRLRGAATQLQQHPLTGVATNRSPDIRDLIVDDTLIRYHVRRDEGLIVILRVWHARKNLR